MHYFFSVNLQHVNSHCVKGYAVVVYIHSIMSCWYANFSLCSPCSVWYLGDVNACEGLWASCLLYKTCIRKHTQTSGGQEMFFLAHLSRRLNWAFLIIICRLSVVVVVVVVVNFSSFLLLLQNQWANFNQTTYKASLGKGEFKFVEMKKHIDNNKRVKVYWRFFKNLHHLLH